MAGDGAEGPGGPSLAERASSFKDRFVGLMGRRSLAFGEGMHIAPCNSIHTFFMRIPIEVVFLDPDGLIVKECRVDGAPMFKRIQPRARGTAFQIKRRMSHIIVTLSDTEDLAPADLTLGHDERLSAWPRNWSG